MGGGPANGPAERFWEAFQVARHSADPASVEKAIELGHALLAAEDVAERRSVLSDLGGLLQTRYHQTGDFEFLQEAVRAVTEAYLLAYGSPEDSASYANNIGMLLHTAFQRNQDRGTLADALDWSRTAVDEEPSTRKAFYLDNLVVALRTAFTVTKDLAPLAEAAEHARAAVACSTDDVSTARSLHFLAVVLRDWSHETGETGVVEEAVDAARRAVELTPAGSSDVLERLKILAYLLDDRYRARGARDDLAELLRVRQTLVAHTPVTDPRHSQNLVELTTTERDWAALTGEGPKSDRGWERADTEAEMCGRYAAEFEQTRDSALLERAIELGRSAAAATPAGHPRRGVRLDHFATALATRGEAFGDRAALAEAVIIEREAVACTSAGHPLRVQFMGNLAVNLNALFHATGDLAHVMDAIDVARRAAEATAGQGDHPRSLGILAVVLHKRFRVTGELQVLSEAVDRARESVRLGASLVAGQAQRLSNLGTMLSDLFTRTGEASVLDEAIDVHRAAADVTADDDPGRAVRLANLGGVLGMAYERFGDRNALQDAIAARRASVAATPQDSPHWPGYTASLAAALGDWCTNPVAPAAARREPPDPQLLAEAVGLARSAVQRPEQDAYSRAGLLTLVANVLALGFRHLGDGDALTEALGCYREAAASAGSPAESRAEAADRWGDLAAEAGHFDVAAEGYAAAVRLLPRLAGRRLGREDAQYWIGRFAGVAADAAACALAAGDEVSAVTLLESGRCVLAAQALDSRGDLSDLHERAPELAERFQTLTAEFETDTTSDRVALADELDAVTDQIRALPGMERFLRPPLLTDLTEQAHEGPIVYVNVSRHRCDALIITPDGVRSRALDRLSEEAVSHRVRALDTAFTKGRLAAEQAIHDTLEWLWDTIVGPVLGELGLTAEPTADGPWPRIWWAPVGPLSLLPLHAAGHHRDGGPVLLDRVVSSTTPTIRALGHARAGRRDDRNEPRLLVVAMPHTPDAPDLPGAQAEADHLAALMPGATVLVGADATRDAVLDALPASGWAHFACHGYSDPDNPSDSHLALHDHDRAPLRVLDLSRLRLRNAEFAFLSACDTARTTARLSDEALHPLAAFQIAGFSQVVGTLWRVDDVVAPAFSRQLYGKLIADRSGALCASAAVHRTVRQLRAKYPNLPSVWAAHVHAGA
ncbi:CHAT domain-containing protein [Streptomyces coeruleorubidus]|uniref:CHAT domain-containing protein n=1 Tax=Streptomyces coeruleorubidus TaxID=116188 RepID=A0A5J6IC05_STRC4|nr:CHAT domain-containing protein [Streptomyces coeruleorubidus]QEV30006.1 CHAT domain-containing protein [Streptomyces coeruleorubidus]GGT84440.1 CHAT domain-containing protein [Streptomyces coeruleorubidus]